MRYATQEEALQALAAAREQIAAALPAGLVLRESQLYRTQFEVAREGTPVTASLTFGFEQRYSHSSISGLRISVGAGARRIRSVTYKDDESGAFNIPGIVARCVLVIDETEASDRALRRQQEIQATSAAAIAAAGRCPLGVSAYPDYGTVKVTVRCTDAQIAAVMAALRTALGAE